MYTVLRSNKDTLFDKHLWSHYRGDLQWEGKVNAFIIMYNGSGKNFVATLERVASIESGHWEMYLFQHEFTFHHTKPDYVYMKRWLAAEPDNFPAYASQYLGRRLLKSYW